jgi:hypothetical protein
LKENLTAQIPPGRLFFATFSTVSSTRSFKKKLAKAVKQSLGMSNIVSSSKLLSIWLIQDITKWFQSISSSIANAILNDGIVSLSSIPPMDMLHNNASSHGGSGKEATRKGDTSTF